jgi:hypothetical protein
MDKNILIFIFILVILFIGHVFLNESFVDVSDTKYQAPSLSGTSFYSYDTGEKVSTFFFYDASGNKLPGKPITTKGEMQIHVSNAEPILYMFRSVELMTKEQIKKEIKYIEYIIKIKNEIPDLVNSEINIFMQNYNKTNPPPPPPPGYESMSQNEKDKIQKDYYDTFKNNIINQKNPKLLNEFNLMYELQTLDKEIAEPFVVTPSYQWPTPYYKSVYDATTKGYYTTFLDDVDGVPVSGEKLWTQDEYIQNPPRFNLITNAGLPTLGIFHGFDINTLKRRLEILKKRVVPDNVSVTTPYAPSELSELPTNYSNIDNERLYNLKSEIYSEITQPLNNTLDSPNITRDSCIGSISDNQAVDFMRYIPGKNPADYIRKDSIPCYKCSIP